MRTRPCSEHHIYSDNLIDSLQYLCLPLHPLHTVCEERTNKEILLQRNTHKGINKFYGPGIDENHIREYTSKWPPTTKHRRIEAIFQLISLKGILLSRVKIQSRDDPVENIYNQILLFESHPRIRPPSRTNKQATASRSENYEECTLLNTLQAGKTLFEDISKYLQVFFGIPLRLGESLRTLSALRYLYCYLDLNPDSDDNVTVYRTDRQLL